MPFLYRRVCDLLQALDDDFRVSRDHAVSGDRIVERWFADHRSRLDAQDTDACAVLSTILPERRTDRVYGVQTNRLQNIVASALALGRSRVQELGQWTVPGSGVDLADCVETILTRTVCLLLFYVHASNKPRDMIEPDCLHSPFAFGDIDPLC